MARKAFFFFLACLLMVSGQAAGSEINKEDARKWLNYLNPLPKEITISGKVEVPIAMVSLAGKEELPESGKFALEDLAAFFRKEAGANVPVNSPVSGGFEITLAVCDQNGYADGKKIPDAGRLAQLPNSDQSYLILTEKDGRLLIVALTGKGLYYGVATLKQLLLPAIKKKRCATKPASRWSGFLDKLLPAFKKDGHSIAFPILSVVDWPDIPERGLWGHNYREDDIVWFADHKLNFMETSNSRVGLDLAISPEGKGSVRVNREALDTAHRHNVNFMPSIAHLDLLDVYHAAKLKDLYQRYPEIMAKGHDYTPGKPFSPCGSSPKFIQFLTDWLSDIAGYPYVADIGITTSEKRKTPCKCAECQKLGGQWAAETTAIVKAWKKVKKEHPALRLWVYTPSSIWPSEDKTKEIISAIPSGLDVNVVEYNYELGLKPIIPSVLADWVSRGAGQAGTCYACPSLTSLDFHRPGYLRYRAKEALDKKVWKHCGYTGLSSITLFDFSMEAIAEWCWNMNGRSGEEFACSYAVRHGIPAPEKFARWVVRLETVLEKIRPWQNLRIWPWDQPETFCRNLEFGKGILMEYAAREEIEKDLVVCRECEDLSFAIGKKEFLYETLTVEGPLKMLKTAADALEAVRAKNPLPESEVNKRIQEAAGETIEALNNWYAMKAGMLESRGWLGNKKKAYIGDIEKIAKALAKSINSLRVSADALPAKAANKENLPDNEELEFNPAAARANPSPK